MKYLFFLLSLLSVRSYAQDFKSTIAAHREQYKQDFVKDAHSPLKEADLQYLNFFDADSTYAVTAAVEPLQNQQSFMMLTSAGTKAEYIRYAHVKFVLNGKPQKLTLYQSISLSKRPGFEDYLFLPFKDETNDKESYGAGRYIDLKTGDIKDGRVLIDFNKAYNPYCAYSAGYQCPMPPAENDLETDIKAGEKQFTGVKKH